MNIMTGDSTVISKKITQTVAERLDYEDFVKIIPLIVASIIMIPKL